MATEPVYVDLTEEIGNWKTAVNGKDVRGSSTSAFTKLQEQTNVCVDYITEKGNEIEQTTQQVQEVRQAAQDAVEHAKEISNKNKTYVDNTVAEYKQYADEVLENATEKAIQADENAAAAGESAATAQQAESVATEKASQAEASATAAEESAKRAEQVSAVEIATTERAGIVKPDGSTITVDVDGIIHGAPTVSTAADVTATDTQGMAGDAGGESDMQALIDAVSDRVVNELVSNTALVEKLEGYIMKSQISNDGLTTEEGYVADARQLNPSMPDTLAGKIAALNSNFEEIWLTERANTGTAGNLNSIVQPGLHKKLINPSSSNSPGFYCYLIVLSYGNGGNITQVAFGYNQTSIAIRYRFDNTWSAWSIK